MFASGYDVVILGGGPAGLATAIRIRQKSPASVLVVEASDAARERIGETVPPDILIHLENLGLVETFRLAGHLPCPGSLSSWGREKPGYNDFILNPVGPAWHLDRRRFEQMLAVRAVDLGAEFAGETRFVSAACKGDGFELLLKHGNGERRTQGRWVVDATGASARFARQQGARQNIQDRLVAIACFFRLRAGVFSAQTLLEATQCGWWYGARLPEDRVLAMFVTEPEDAKRLTANHYALWRQQLQSTNLLAPRLGSCEIEEKKFLSLPVVSSILDPLEGERWLAVGDAASCYDPISSQGIYKALADASDAASHVLAKLEFSRPPSWRYSQRVQDRFQNYLANRQYLYRLEQRWPEARFWSRRASAANWPAPRVMVQSL